MAKQIYIQPNGEKIRKVLFNEVSFIIAIVGVVASIILFTTGQPNDNKTEIEKLKLQFGSEQELSAQLQNIKDNDLHTIENDVKDLENKMEQVGKDVLRIETILNERLPKQL